MYVSIQQPFLDTLQIYHLVKGCSQHLCVVPTPNINNSRIVFYQLADYDSLPSRYFADYQDQVCKPACFNTNQVKG